MNENNGSAIQSVLEHIRFTLNRANLNLKYSDHYVVRHLVQRAVHRVMARESFTDVKKVVVKVPITFAPNIKYYQLPPCVERVYWLAEYDTRGNLNYILPTKSGEWQPYRHGWALDGNTLRMDQTPTTAASYELAFSPNGDFSPHFADGGDRIEDDDSVTSTTQGTYNPDGTFTLASVPRLGLLMRRENAYVGQHLTLLDDSGLVETRLITAYDVATRKCTLRTPFTKAAPEVTPESVTYEVGMPPDTAFMAAVTAAACLEFTVSKDLSQKMRQYIEINYMAAIKDLEDRMQMLNASWQKSYGAASPFGGQNAYEYSFWR